MPHTQPSQEPFALLYLCPECGHWLATNTLMEAFTQIAGLVAHICPHDNRALVAVKPEDRLQLRELHVAGEEVQ